MTDATRATTFDDLGSELNVFDTTTNRSCTGTSISSATDRSSRCPARWSILATTCPAQEIIRGSGPEQIFVKGDLLFVSQLHSDKIEVFRINQTPAEPSQILTHIGLAVHRRHLAAGRGGLA